MSRLQEVLIAARAGAGGRPGRRRPVRRPRPSDPAHGQARAGGSGPGVAAGVGRHNRRQHRRASGGSTRCGRLGRPPAARRAAPAARATGGATGGAGGAGTGGRPAGPAARAVRPATPSRAETGTGGSGGIGRQRTRGAAAVLAAAARRRRVRLHAQAGGDVASRSQLRADQPGEPARPARPNRPYNGGVTGGKVVPGDDGRGVHHPQGRPDPPLQDQRYQRGPWSRT